MNRRKKPDVLYFLKIEDMRLAGASEPHYLEEWCPRCPPGVPFPIWTAVQIIKYNQKKGPGGATREDWSILLQFWAEEARKLTRAYYGANSRPVVDGYKI